MADEHDLEWVTVFGLLENRLERASGALQEQRFDRPCH